MARVTPHPQWKSSPWFETPNVAIFRDGRFLVAELRGAHRVLTTSTCVGGVATAIRHVVNHQSCEGADHGERYSAIHRLGPEAYHRSVCTELALDPETTAVMGTAANMIYAAHEMASFDALRVDAIVTAGVEGNAVCAGDPAEWIETPQGWNKLPKVGGTINTMLFVNQALRPEAEIRMLLTITEAKSAALAELGVSSRYSQDLATGTGTDQVTVAMPSGPDRYAYSSTSPHTRLGELLGRAVRRAVANALRWQNGLEPSLTRSVAYALRRFGFTEAAFHEAMRARLSESAMRLLEKNRNAVLYEPQVAAAAYGYAAVLDRLRYGVLPVSAAREVLRHQAATLAAALAARAEQWHTLWLELQVDADRPMDAVYDAIALGWSRKWDSINP